MKDNKKKVIELIKAFCQSFDEKNWDKMAKCLDDEIDADYSSLRGTPRQLIAKEDYIKLRKQGLANLKTTHLTEAFQITKNSFDITCKCQFEIKRFATLSDLYFHSYGNYEFAIREMNEGFKITRIKQVVSHNKGEPHIHLAFRENKKEET